MGGVSTSAPTPQNTRAACALPGPTTFLQVGVLCHLGILLHHHCMSPSKRPSLGQLIRLQAQLPVLAMTMVQLQLTARLCQQPRHQLDVFCWQGLLGRAALREVLHMLSSSARSQ